MVVITKDTFHAIARVIEKSRLDLQKKYHQLQIMEEKNGYMYTLTYKLAKQDFLESLSYSMWVVYNDLQRVEYFKDYLHKKGDLEKKQGKILDLIYQYIRFLDIGVKYLNIELRPEHKRFIRRIYEIINDFSNYYSQLEDKAHLMKKYKETRGLAQIVEELVDC